MTPNQSETLQQQYERIEATIAFGEREYACYVATAEGDYLEYDVA